MSSSTLGHHPRKSPGGAHTRRRDRALSDPASRFQMLPEDRLPIAKIETIAHVAGFTKGAIYSNFSSKQDLVLALVTERIASYTRRAEDALSQSSGPQQLLDVLASHLTDEVMDETAWHALMTELAVGTATDPALKELYRNIDDNLRSPFTALLTSSGLFDTAQEARVLVRSLLAAVHGFVLELIVDREAVSRDDVARTLRVIATTHVAHHVNTSSRRPTHTTEAWVQTEAARRRTRRR